MANKKLLDKETEEKIQELTASSLAELQGSCYWVEMDEDYFADLRKRFNASADEIGPRKFKTFINKDLPIYMIVIPAGRLHNQDKVVQYYHTIVEDLHLGECNGSYELVTEDDLISKYNINYSGNEQTVR